MTEGKMITQEIKNQIDALNPDEQLALIERLVQRLRKRQDDRDWENDLVAMAADPDIQREIRLINEEFAAAEEDGLEGL
jgi:hypothetical protein